VETDETIEKAVTRGKRGLFTASEIRPSVKQVSKPYLLKELMCLSVMLGLEEKDVPKCKNWPIPRIILWLKEKQPPQSEFNFMINMMDMLKNEIDEHFNSHYHVR
jgi:hypothetical protein